MDFKLANELSIDDSNIKKITLEEIEKKVNESDNRGAIFYLHKDNAEKDIKKLLNHFKNHTTFLRDLKYGLDAKDSIYELHII